jgi:hypothetical protein
MPVATYLLILTSATRLPAVVMRISHVHLPSHLEHTPKPAIPHSWRYRSVSAYESVEETRSKMHRLSFFPQKMPP